MVSDIYLGKVRRSVRRTPNPDLDEELIDLIEECRQDLQAVGVCKEKTQDETDRTILGAVRCFVRWRFSLGSNESQFNREDYMLLRDELRKRSCF